MVQDVLFFVEIEITILKNPIPIFLVRDLDRRSMMWCHGDVTALSVLGPIIVMQYEPLRPFNAQRLLSNVYKRLLKIS